MRLLFLIAITLLLFSCGGSGKKSDASTSTKPTIFTEQSEINGYGGNIISSDEIYTFTSHTSSNCKEVWMCRRVELHVKLALPATISYSFNIQRYVDIENEIDCGTYGGGKLKGCYTIISQFWNETAGPRVYMTLQRKRLEDGTLEQDSYTLLFQNKDDVGKVTTYYTFIIQADEWNKVSIINTGYSITVCVNGLCTEKIVADTTDDGQQYFKFGLYWQSAIYKNLDTINLDKHIIIKFKSVGL